MPPIRRGAHGASPVPPARLARVPPTSHGRTSPSRVARGSVRLILAAILATTVLSPGAGTPAVEAATNYLLMPRSELLGLPTSGTAWSNLRSIADASLGSPDLCDMDRQHGVRALAAALVYARTGASSYGTKARGAVMAAIKTLRSCESAMLSLGRQLGSYVLAADFADLSGSDETSFRNFLSKVRTQNLGGHSAWYTLKGTHLDAQNNWGSFAGASRIAASLYIGDTADVAAAAKVTRGFLGDRSAYAFKRELTSEQVTWTCSGSRTNYTPTNGSCTKSGINVDGAIVTDIARGGSLRWPPRDPGISYVLESMQGLVLQVELLYRNGYPDAWKWSNSALKRIAGTVSRSGASGGTTWNHSSVKRHLPWILNRRYGLSLPTQPAGMGRIFGFTDWLYGSRSTASVSAPIVTAPAPVLRRSTSVPTSGVTTLVQWSLKSASSALRRYDLQYQVNGGSWRSVSLSSSTTTSVRFTLGSGTYRFRARGTDTNGRVGAWTYGPKTAARSLSEASSAVSYAGTWSTASHSSYLGGKLRYTRTSGATATIRFTGRSFQWVGPVGPGRGKSQVYVDGTLMTTVDQYASSFSARRVLFAISLASGSHRIVIKALGTSGRPTVALDAAQYLVTL